MYANGTLVWYYSICKREVWLMARQIIPDQKDVNIDIGRFLHENTYNRDKKEIAFGHVKFDIFQKTKDGIVIGEIKKSSRAAEASKMQLLYYLYTLKRAGLKARGVLKYPDEKKNEDVVLDEEAEKKLRACVEDIEVIASSDVPPAPVKTRYCKNCAYREYCYA